MPIVDSLKRLLQRFPRLPLVILLTVSVLFLLPQLQVPWMLIDDGEDLRIVRELNESFSKFDFGHLFRFEAHNGRFRPVYWLFHWLTISILGHNAYLHHLGHLFLYLLITLLFYLLVNHLSRSSMAAFFSGLFFLVWGPGAENLYRLGTAEPQLVLYLLLTLFFLVRGNLILSLFTLPLVYLSKESGTILVIISFFIVLITLFWKTKEKIMLSSKRAAIYLFANIFLAIFVRWLMFHFNVAGGYSSSYIFSLNQITNGTLQYLKMIYTNYGALFLICLVMLFYKILRLLFGRRNKNHVLKWEIIFVFWFFIFVLFQSPWVFIMGRYLPPALLGLCYVLGVEFVNLYKFSQKQIKTTRWGSIIFLLLALLFLRAVVPGGKQIFAMYRKVSLSESTNTKAISFLAQSTPSNGRIFYNFSDGAVEFLYEMGVHFTLLYNRPDIETSYLYLEGDSDFKKGDIIVSWRPSFYRYPWEKVVKHFKNLEEIKNVDNEWHIMVFKDNESVGPLLFDRNGLKSKEKTRGTFSFVDGQSVKIPIDKKITSKGRITFLWQTPAVIKDDKKISLIYQEKDTPLVWAEKDKICFGIFNRLIRRWEVVSVRENFLTSKKYPVSLSWGPQGMTLSLKNVLRFHPYYQGLSSESDLVLGPISNNEFQDKSGRIYEFEFFAEE